MKILQQIKCAIFSTIAISMFGCNDAGYSSIENGVYIAEAAPSDKFNQQIETKLVDEVNLNEPLTMRLVQPVSVDVTVNLEFDAAMIDAYNAEHSTNYQILPEEFMELEKKATIRAGEVSATALSLVIKPYPSPNGEAYAIPVRIASVEGPVSVIGSANKILFLLTSPNKQKSVVMKRGETQTNFKAEIPTQAWTFEYWIKVNNKTGYSTSSWEGEQNRNFRSLIFGDNSAPVHLGGNESVLLRYWADGVKKIAPTLQCQLDGAYFDSNEFWYPDTWYHIAYTYDGATVTLYKDGVEDNSLKVEKTFNFNKLTFCSTFGWQMEVEFAQIRLWNKCLPANVIQDGMSRQISSDSDGLVGYWKCDEGSGKLLKDSSPNGNDITLTNTTVNWSENIYNFAHPNGE